jgi:DNA-binding CsgD family transcriptional regulator
VTAGSTSRSLLTRRQIDVLARVCDGYSLEEVAASLDISTDVVKVHLQTIRRRLHARTTTQAAFIAADLNLLNLNRSRSPISNNH